MFPNLKHSLDSHSPPTTTSLLSPFTAEVERQDEGCSHLMCFPQTTPVGLLSPLFHQDCICQGHQGPPRCQTQWSSLNSYLTSQQGSTQLTILSLKCLVSPGSLRHQSFLDFFSNLRGCTFSVSFAGFYFSVLLLNTGVYQSLLCFFIHTFSSGMASSS